MNSFAIATPPLVLSLYVRHSVTKVHGEVPAVRRGSFYHEGLRCAPPSGQAFYISPRPDAYGQDSLLHYASEATPALPCKPFTMKESFMIKVRLWTQLLGE